MTPALLSRLLAIAARKEDIIPMLEGEFPDGAEQARQDVADIREPVEMLQRERVG